MVSFTTVVTAGLLASSSLALPHAHQKFHQKRSSSSSKRGAAYNDASLVSTLTSTGTVSWAYDWNDANDGTLPSGIEYVPMLWGSKMFDGWSSAVETALSSGSSYILGFNEPDMTSQADMSASDAATYYKQYITPYADRASLVTPAVTSSTDSGMGLEWMASFLEACTDCNATAMAVHWYGEAASDFKSFVEQAIETASNYSISSVWITEFGLSSGTDSEAASFIEEVVPWLDSQSAVGRYAYFYCADGYLCFFLLRLDGQRTRNFFLFHFLDLLDIPFPYPCMWWYTTT
ncbi:hypothetical protein ASPZODRAFT_586808 [Penicilliopsis zonata CBS 506.65]|uniref:Asl1-like glycosyl hydrolase catalytic domain-containing protein n=1 Tax=Penicilliopsis zonata CBS 506.65 TaxID=1073090 RepID=A0A1L9SE65_9EURO|nr:hypothetical protein ASPZODRAFT_586808 [Penicilliopsis zonata CBS 506.65]OJJ45398.1 hypothetical protein ASPZODRAFT_586808 [Penicilliopsis zonata CBS 506.65]